ncbi:hypothetical protein EON68_00180, partial [archaeon]
MNAAATSLWITDYYNHRIRHVSLTSGIITTVAGNGVAVAVHADVANATSSTVVTPHFLALHEPTNRLYFTEAQAHRVRYLALMNGTLHTVLGNTTSGMWGDGGFARAAGTIFPSFVFVEPLASGLPQVWVVDNVRTRIRRINAQGTICTVLGDAVNGTAPCSDRWRSSIQGTSYYRVVVDAESALWAVTAETSSVLRITADGNVSTIAGTGVAGWSGDFGPASSARLHYPLDVWVSPSLK